jgi:hypothetical protein
MRFTLLLMVLAACGSSSDGRVSLPDGPTGNHNVTFTNFAARTGSLSGADQDSEMQIAMTDGIGSLACSLPSDQHNGLGAMGHEIIMNLQASNGFPCPVGSFGVPSDCPDDPGPLGSVRERCAYYREFDASGSVVGTLRATAGTVTVMGDENSCTFQTTFSFSGQQWTDSFTVTNLLAPEPWCKTN